jgi:MFS family permease
MPATDVLKIRDFRWFLTTRFFITIATQMLSVIVGWQVYELTRDPLSLGLIGLSEALSYFAVALYAGHVADSNDRRNILVVTSVLLTAGAGALFVISWKYAALLAAKGAFPIYAVVFLLGGVRGFIYPANMALVAQLVPRELYARSSAWNSLFWQVAAVSGPALAGLIYGFFGINWAYGAAILATVTGLAAVVVIKPRGKPKRDKDEPIMTSLSSGVKFVFKNQMVLSAMSLDMFAVLFGGATAMLPMVADAILHVGPKGLGFLRAAPAIGAAVMSLALAQRPPLANAGRRLLWVVAGFGVSMIVFALSRNFWLSLFALAVSGAFDNVSVVIRSTIVQLFTPDEMRGRVASVNSVFIGSSNEIGAFESGLAAKLLGLVPSLLFNSGMTFIVAGAVAWAAPVLRKLDLSKTK